MAQYYTLVTDTGTKKIAEMIATGSKLNLVKIQLGDGGGSYYEPSTKQTALKNKLHEINVNNIKTNAENPNWITIEGIVEAKVGGFYIREVGIFDDSNQLIAIAKYSETYKPLPSEGTAKELVIRVVIDIDNVDSINMSVNADISVATKDDIKELETKIDNIKVNNNFQTATGTGTEITIDIDMDKIQNGDSFTFIASATNGGAATTVNGKPLYKPNTTTAPNIVSGKAYSIWYNAPGDCFFIKASAEGDADVSHVLATKKFSNDNDTNLVGTMPNNGALNGSLNAGGSFNIPKGYTEGGTITANSLASQTQATAQAGDILSGQTAIVNGNKVTGTMANLVGQTVYGGAEGVNTVRIYPSNTGFLQVINTPSPNSKPHGYIDYTTKLENHIPLNILASALGITANKIVSGNNICGVNGSATVQSMGGVNYTSGSLTRTGSYFTVSGLPFTPNLVITTGWTSSRTMFTYNQNFNSSPITGVWAYNEGKGWKISVNTSAVVLNSDGFTWQALGGSGDTILWWAFRI